MPDAIAPRPEPRLAPTLAALGDRPRAVLNRLAGEGFVAVQLSATQPGLRPGDLDRSGRRDLARVLGRLELAASGLDLWIPPAHFRDRARVDRAVAAVRGAVELAADLGRCPVSLALPDGDDESLGPVVEAMTELGLRHGVLLADHAVPPAARDGFGAGIDPVAWLAAGRDPVAAVEACARRLVSARLCDALPGGARGPIDRLEGGRLDAAAYRAALAGAEYLGPLVVDVRGWSRPWEGLAHTVRVWSSLTGGARR